jgi:hypothetical protein
MNYGRRSYGDRDKRSVTTIRQAPIYGQRMIIQKVSFSPWAFSDYLMYPQ